MEHNRRGRPPKNKNKENANTLSNVNNNNTTANNTNTHHAPKAVKTPPAGYIRCKHKQCNVYCEDEDAQRRHMEDFKYHRHHYKQHGEDCNKCLELVTQPLWRRIIELRELMYLARDLVQLVETTRNTPAVLGDP
eukprot:TRINITY_DN14595_c0_g1_i1.p2 TRINITY_DN14595_c0_g1~~TRINITY_DN14595_c0_g1_i1.p2  ORF type:complete len:135 (-),score=39.32 TRINITY_DN14595_c0_g1_i1:48-452(-)